MVRESIPDDAWTPVHYPGAVVDPDTGELISDAEVAEATFTTFASTKHPVTARLVGRRVRDQNQLEELFPVWSHHPFFTNRDEATVGADPTHRRHAVIETMFADLIDGPLAHLPSVIFSPRPGKGQTRHSYVRHRDRVAGSLPESRRDLAAACVDPGYLAQAMRLAFARGVSADGLYSFSRAVGEWVGLGGR